jgi:hypothetical protein
MEIILRVLRRKEIIIFDTVLILFLQVIWLGNSLYYKILGIECC